MSLKSHFNSVKLDYIMEIMREVYQGFKLENVKCLHFANVLIRLTCDDTNPLYKGFNLDRFSLNFQCVKWAASSSSNLMLPIDSFFAKHKNNYKFLRKIHYLEKKRNLSKLNLINDEYDDLFSEITKWYNKWVTNGYSINKQLFLYGEHYTELQKFIN